MNIKKYFIFIILLISSVLYNNIQTLGFTGNIITEFDKLSLSSSILNPYNILDKPDQRTEVIILVEDNYDVFYGELTASIRGNFQYLETNKTFILSDSKLPKNNFNEQINELFYTKNFEQFLISLGRKKLRWGIGYSFSPTDIITKLATPEDPTDRLYARKGTDLLQCSIPLESSQFDFVYFPDIKQKEMEFGIKKHRQALRVYKYIDPFDLSIVTKYAQQNKWTIGSNTAVTIGNSLEIHGEYIFNSSNNKLYPNYINNPEQFFNTTYSNKDNSSYELLIGGQYTLQNNLNMSLEYIYFSNGYNNDEWEAYYKHVKYLNQSIYRENNINLLLAGINNAVNIFQPPIRQHYLFTRIYKNNFLEYYSIEWLNFMGLANWGGIQIFQFVFSKSAWYNIYLRVKYFYGVADSEFSLVPEHTNWIIGTTVYF